MTDPAPPRRPDLVTMSDIAQRAGVSRPTVSIVLNGHHKTIGIAPQTRERVLAAARDLGYRRNALARAVKTGRSRTLGFLAGAADVEYCARAFSGILDGADAKDYSVQRFRLYDRPEDQSTIERCSEHRLDGIIVNDTGLARNVELIRREFEGRGVPVIWLDPKAPQNWGIQVRPDDEGGSVAAVRHLIQLGHRRIGFVGGIEGVGTSIPRFGGFKRAMEEAGLAVDMVRWTNWYYSNSGLAIQKWLMLPSPPTAIFCGSDAMALALMRQARRAGLRIPDDLSVIGFGGLLRVELSDPSLSTISVPYNEMGNIAVSELLSLIDCNDQARILAHKDIVLATTFIDRESSGPSPS